MLRFHVSYNTFGPRGSRRAGLVRWGLRYAQRDTKSPYDGKWALGTIHLAPGEMSTGDVVSLCRDLGGGIRHAILNMPNVHEIEPLRIFGREIIPEVAGI